MVTGGCCSVFQTEADGYEIRRRSNARSAKTDVVTFSQRGSGVQLVAYLEVSVVDNTQMGYQQWKALDRTNLYPELVPRECGICASCYTSPKGSPRTYLSRDF